MSNPKWCVKSREFRDNFVLRLEFEDGSVKDFDCKPLFNERIYAPLKDINFFYRAKALYGSIMWSDNLDIAPEYLYDHGVNVKA